MGRADRFVEAATNVAPLARRLLGRTWLVDRLSTALRLSQTTGRGLDFVTSDGELLAADGTLVVGPRQAAASILSRRSELRACHEQVRELEQQLAHHAAICARLESERIAAETNSASLVATYTASAGKLGECGQATAAARGRLERVSDEVHRIEQELCRSEERVSTLEVDLQATRREQIEAKHATAQLANQLQSGDTALDVLRQRQSELQAAASQRQIAAAKCEQRVEMLMHQVEQAARSQQERERVLADTCQRLAERNSLVAELEATILAGGQVLAVLSLRKEEEGREMARQAAAIEATRLERTTIADRIRDERQQFAAIQSQLHKLEVAVTRLRHERHTLFERMQEDYGIDLEIAANSRVQEAENRAIEVESTDFLPAPGRAPSGWLGAFDREAAEREIAELRSQINHIGAINLEALDELEQLEARFEMLSSQYRDLVDAKASLERIIQRINVDSRQLFLDTLETVCEHFQELFRRLFGGGEADIVVDDAQDVLECGIEIVARPPGKEACSISLLSGGEKTLTCVALLLAVFRSKPSPFCVLDEVDAALDEANIGRFIGVLREFLSFTQFVVVTHSKKTMSGADTLYGVTMEESGVSKRVSVRFEDVSEDGQIRASALRHAA
jgi:chromosome segregation protein